MSERAESGYGEASSDTRSYSRHTIQFTALCRATEELQELGKQPRTTPEELERFRKDLERFSNAPRFFGLSLNEQWQETQDCLPSTEPSASSGARINSDSPVEQQDSGDQFQATPKPLTATSTSADLIIPEIERVDVGKDFNDAEEAFNAVVQVLDKNWRPYHLVTRLPLPETIAGKIPKLDEMMSFHPDLLHNVLGGSEWASGLQYVPFRPGPCILWNRAYYTLDPETDPHLPKAPGQHGAKLVPFIATNPEHAPGMPAGLGDTKIRVPLFVLLPEKNGPKRYFYFGHYSQTRSPDRMDHDRMLQCVPIKVLEFWARELASRGRGEWLTDKLKHHFWPLPTYIGELFDTSYESGGNIAEEDMAQHEKHVRIEIAHFTAALRKHNFVADVKVADITEDFIIDAFFRADADQPPALRLWWEYLECIDWIPEFYNMMVQYQDRYPYLSRP